MVCLVYEYSILRRMFASMVLFFSFLSSKGRYWHQILGGPISAKFIVL